MIVDGTTILIIAVSTFLGYKKGFISLSVKLLACIIAIVATMILLTPVTNFIINVTAIDETIENTIIDKVNEAINGNVENDMANELVVSATEGTLTQKAEEISTLVIKAAVGIILFLLIRVVLVFVTSIANLIAKIPVIKEINKAGGIAYGLVRGLLLIYVILLLISLISLINIDTTINEKIEESTITKSMYENNIISKFIL